tara:strand:+ start:1028 stop:2173 length:1146 start_codon:yes stop_codon:yes gene_type:complete
MGYKNFKYGDKLDPEKLNSKFLQLFDLVEKSYHHNNALRARVEALNLAMGYANSYLGASDDVFADADMYSHTSLGEDEHKFVIGAKHFTANHSVADLNWESSNNFQILGHRLMLAEDENSTVSRIPLSINQYDESVPSLGLSVTSDSIVFDTDKLWMLLSNDTIWTEQVKTINTNPLLNYVTFDITIPQTLTPLVNRIVAVPLFDLSYQVHYNRPNNNFVCETPPDGGDPTGYEWKVGYLDWMLESSDSLANIIKLRIKGESLGNNASIFGFSSLQAFYHSFVTSGEAVISLDFAGTSGNTRVINDINWTGDNLESVTLYIYDDDPTTSGQIVFNSEIDTLGDDIDVSMDLDTIYIKLILTKANDTSASLESLTINYTEVT